MIATNWSCKDCKKRVVGCHASCEDYQAKLVKHVEKREALHKEQTTSWDINGLIVDTIRKRKGKPKR